MGYDFETRRKLADSELGFSEHNWQTFAELGWLALMVPEEYGGLGGTIQDAIVLQEKLGKGMVVEPFFSTVILSANLINKAGSSEQKASGSVSSIGTEAVKEGNGYVINGRKQFVLNANASDLLLISARTSDNGQSGISVFVVPTDSAGLTRKDYKANDGSSASNLTIEQLYVDADAVLGQFNLAADAVEET